jgi:hypothetical protein
MTVKQAYEYSLMELRKHKSPSLHLEDYNYYLNKGIQEYANDRYTLFETSQQLTDDLQPLMTSTLGTITGNKLQYTGGYTSSVTAIDGTVTNSPVDVTFGKRYGSDYYQFPAPKNYWHTTGSHVTTVSLRNHKCSPAGSEINVPSKKLPIAIANGIINNSYLKPDGKRPYHLFTDGGLGSVKPDLIYLIGNSRLNIIKDIHLDYLKEPSRVELTVFQRDTPVDSSETFEFPEYACNEIIKKVVKLILEASSDVRLNTHIPVNKTT